MGPALCFCVGTPSVRHHVPQHRFLAPLSECSWGGCGVAPGAPPSRGLCRPGLCRGVCCRVRGLESVAPPASSSLLRWLRLVGFPGALHELQDCPLVLWATLGVSGRIALNREVALGPPDISTASMLPARGPGVTSQFSVSVSGSLLTAVRFLLCSSHTVLTNLPPRCSEASRGYRSRGCCRGLGTDFGSLALGAWTRLSLGVLAASALVTGRCILRSPLGGTRVTTHGMWCSPVFPAFPKVSLAGSHLGPPLKRGFRARKPWWGRVWRRCRAAAALPAVLHTLAGGLGGRSFLCLPLTSFKKQPHRASGTVLGFLSPDPGFEVRQVGFSAAASVANRCPPGSGSCPPWLHPVVNEVGSEITHPEGLGPSGGSPKSNAFTFYIHPLPLSSSFSSFLPFLSSPSSSSSSFVVLGIVPRACQLQH